MFQTALKINLKLRQKLSLTSGLYGTFRNAVQMCIAMGTVTKCFVNPPNHLMHLARAQAFFNILHTSPYLQTKTSNEPCPKGLLKNTADKAARDQSFSLINPTFPDAF